MKILWWVLVLFLKSSSVFSQDYQYEITMFTLVNGSIGSEGRVEVIAEKDSSNEVEGVLSDSDWTIDKAHAVCRILGFPNAIFAPGGSRFGKGSQPRVFSNLNPTGDTPTVDLKCIYRESGGSSGDGVAECTDLSVESAGLICNEPRCFRFGRGERDALIRRNDAGSNDECLALCQAMKSLFVAQREDMCYCFNDPSILDEMRDDCNTECDDNDQQKCGGGPDRYTVFNASLGFCPDISGANLTVYGHDGGYRLGDIVRANCSGGLYLVGDDVLECIRGYDSFTWNGTIPTCVDGTTAQPSISSALITDPSMRPSGRPTMPNRLTDATALVSMNMDRDALADSKSLVVPVSLSVVGVVIVAVLAMLFLLYINKTRKSKPGMDQNVQEIKQKSTFSNLSYSMETIPNPEGPSYYEVGEKAVDSTDAKAKPKTTFNNMSYSHETIPNSEGPSYYEVAPNTDKTDGTNGLIDNVLYKQADDIRGNANEYELDKDSAQNQNRYGLIDNVLYNPTDNIRKETNQNDQNRNSPNDTLHYGLIDNVLYKPVENVADLNSNKHRGVSGNQASEDIRELPNGNEAEYASPDEQGSREGELIDNVLYKPANSHEPSTSASRKYYEIASGTPECASGDYAEADCPAPKNNNSVRNGPKYYDIELHPELSPSVSETGNHNDGYFGFLEAGRDPDAGYDKVTEKSLKSGYDAVDETVNDVDEEFDRPRFVVRTDDTPSPYHGYTSVGNDDEPLNISSENADNGLGAKKPFPRYAKVQK